MYTPITNPIFGTVAPIASTDISLHVLLGLSWHILLPYTIFGALLMIYSQTRLMRGQRELKRSNLDTKI
jgi:hypothetical protein